MPTPISEMPSSKKRLMLFLVPLLLLAAVLALLITMDQSRPYKKITVGEATFYVPKKFLTEYKADLMGMLRDYVGGIELEKYQFSAYADEILPADLIGSENIAGSSIIWTIEKHETVGKTYLESGSINTLTHSDTSFIKGTGPFATREVVLDEKTGLFKLTKLNSDGRNYAFANNNPATLLDKNTNVWLSHCIEFSALRADGVWGRCTRQMVTQGLLVQIHYDGRLISETANLSDVILRTMAQWQTEPSQ